jgi:hypothetical protein
MGMTSETLKESLIYDLGFNERGELFLDYGQRRIKVKLLKDLKLSFQDETTGKIYKSLPKPNKKDDKIKAE